MGSEREGYVKNLSRTCHAPNCETASAGPPATAVGKEAAEFTRETVQGKKVRLEYEHPRVDRHRRTLAEKVRVIRN